MVNLHRLAVVFKAADVLHMDTSRTAPLAVRPAELGGTQKSKELARRCISGFNVDGTRVVVSAIVSSDEESRAVAECRSYVTEKEWAPMTDALEVYGLPYSLEFEVLDMQRDPLYEGFLGSWTASTTGSPTGPAAAQGGGSGNDSAQR